VMHMHRDACLDFVLYSHALVENTVVALRVDSNEIVKSGLGHSIKSVVTDHLGSYA